MLNFSYLTLHLGFFGRDLGFKLVFGFGPGLGLNFRVRAGFGPELVGPFTTLLSIVKNLVLSNKARIRAKYDPMVLKQPFFQKITKNRPAAVASPP